MLTNSSNGRDSKKDSREVAVQAFKGFFPRFSKMFPMLQVEQDDQGMPPGRKFTLAKYTFLLVTLGFFTTALSPALGTNFTVFVGALATLYTIYCGGNVSQRWVETPKPETRVVLDRRRAAPNVESKSTENQVPDQKGPGPAGG